MKRKYAVVLACLVLGAFIAGCNNRDASPSSGTMDTPPAGVTDEASAIRLSAESDPFVTNDEQTFTDQAVLPTNYTYVAGQLDAAITPLRWGRFVTNVTRQTTVTVLAGDTTAVGHVHKTIVGTLKIRALQGTDTVTIQKPFTDVSDRNVMFVRVGRGRTYWRNWVPAASSLVKGGSQDTTAISITRLDLFSSTDTITVTDPLSYYLKYGWANLFHRGRHDVSFFTPGDSVKIRVTLSGTSTDTDLVSLRFGFDNVYRGRSAMALVSQSGNVKVYEGSFRVFRHPGFFNAAVEAASRATLYDDSPSAYNVSWWGLPYRVN